MKNTSSHATLFDVAKAAGVGTTTVSRVINGGESVSHDTLARVQAVIDKLGYQPNQAARILKGKRTKTIGLIVPSIADPFFSMIAEAAQQIARVHDSVVIVTVSNNNPRVELENLNVLIRHRTDGLLFAPALSHNRSLAKMLDHLSIPSVTFDRPLYHSSILSVLSNNYEGAKAATQHLISHGCRRILCLGGETDLYTIKERMRGYTDAVSDAGLPAIFSTSITDFTSAKIAIESQFYSTNPPDAVFALKNSATIYACEVFQSLNIQVPKKVALVGFDDFDLAATLRPSISVVRQPSEDVGRIAAELLFDQLTNGKRTRASSKGGNGHVKLENQLILRDSCGCRTMPV